MRTAFKVAFALALSLFLQPGTARAQDLGFASLSLGRDHACAILTNTTLRCWGSGEFGQTGMGHRRDTLRPQRPRMSGAGYIAIDAGEFSTIAIRGVNTVVNQIYGTGSNATGQLGGGPGPDMLNFGALPLGRPRWWVGVSLGVQHACGALEGGGVRCWGANPNGELGDGTTNDAALAVLTRRSGRFTDVSAGFLFTCGLDDRGTGFCWGYNGFGALGTGDFTGRTTPARIALLPRNLGDLSAGDLSACAVTRRDDIHCWGDNSAGQLGIGTVGGVQNAPVPLEGDSDDEWQQVSVGSTHACGLQVDGSVYCWGSNNFGQLGNGTFIDSPTRVAVINLPGPALRVYASFDFSCSTHDVPSSSTPQIAIYCWGINSSGQLGINSRVLSPVPVQVQSIFQ